MYSGPGRGSQEATWIPDSHQQQRAVLATQRSVQSGRLRPESTSPLTSQNLIEMNVILSLTCGM